MADTETDMSDDADAWAGERVQRWLRLADALDRQLSPVNDVLFPAAALAPGERVLDVGCGEGRTTRRAAAQVGPSGSVVGLDVSDEMLVRASQVPAPDGAATIDWIAADVSAGSSAWQPDPPFDAVISTFGVMFFDDPSTAFATLAEATRPGGRLAAAVWCARDESELFGLPLAVATEVLDRHGRDYEPLAGDEGAFSIHSASIAESLLGGAGWADVGYAVHRLPMQLAGGLAPAEAATASLDFGPIRYRVEGQPEELRDEMVAALTEIYEDRVDGDGYVVVTGTVGVITATRPRPA